MSNKINSLVGAASGSQEGETESEEGESDDVFVVGTDIDGFGRREIDTLRVF